MELLWLRGHFAFQLHFFCAINCTILIRSHHLVTHTLVWTHGLIHFITIQIYRKDQGYLCVKKRKGHLEKKWGCTCVNSIGYVCACVHWCALMCATCKPHQTHVWKNVLWWLGGKKKDAKAYNLTQTSGLDTHRSTHIHTHAERCHIHTLAHVCMCVRVCVCVYMWV